MYRFFINRPIVAMVIAILMVIVGAVSMTTLPVAQFPQIAPPEMSIRTTYVGADAKTVTDSVAEPIEEQMAGVDNMNYMYSINANNGSVRIGVNFDVKTDPNIDLVLTQLREKQAEDQLPVDVRNFGITIIKSPTTPFLIIGLYSPKGTHDSTFLANYAYINLVDQISESKGVSNVQVFGAGQYAMRFWVKPDQLAKMNITVNDIVNAISAQNTVNPVGQVGGPPTPPGQEYTYTAMAQGRLVTEKDFEQIVIRENPDGSVVRLKDIARVELGAQVYTFSGHLNGAPSAILAIYQLPGSNALDTERGVLKLMAEFRKQFPPDLEYVVALDTTLAVSAGIHDIMRTLITALILVIIVVFIFLQGWRASLIPLCAVPVSLIGTFVFFPFFGFSINTLSLFGLVLAIGLVVDDAIVVVEATERHIEEGFPPKDAALKAMHEVAGPVVSLALIMGAVFIPTIFISGITGRLYQQFALTIVISVMLSAFNAVSLSPALAAKLLKPKPKDEPRSPLGKFYKWFNRTFDKARDHYVDVTDRLICRSALVLIFLAVVGALCLFLGSRLPSSFLPQEDQGYVYAVAQLPYASSLIRTDDVCKKMEDIIEKTPGVQYCTTVEGFSLLSQLQATYNAFFFITFKPWSERTKSNEKFDAICAHLNAEFAKLPEANAIAFPPPDIPGVGTAGGITFMLEDRSGRSDLSFLTQNVNQFMDAIWKRPELSGVNTTYLPEVPQVFFNVDRDKVLKQGVAVSDVYRTLQTFMGGYFVNYFNRFGRQWQVYIQAEQQYRSDPGSIGQFYVRNNLGEALPLTAFTTVQHITGPEYILHYNEFPCAQINAAVAHGYSSGQAMAALEQVFARTMPSGMGYDYFGMSYQEQKAAQGTSPGLVFGLSVICVFLILAAQFESWTLPVSVLLGTPLAIIGAFLALNARGFQNTVFVQIGLIMLIGLAAKNAILIVAFAKAEFEKGKSITEAALTGAHIRLRPILMTSFAFILGCVPLWVAGGSGAASRQVLGTVVIGGMLTAVFLGVFAIPVAFSIVEQGIVRCSKKARERHKNIPPEPTG
jgi:hydrophobic/amphiphilic exporter-1 (mainly G- bacteria), HAE1 family